MLVYMYQTWWFPKVFPMLEFDFFSSKVVMQVKNKSTYSEGMLLLKGQFGIPRGKNWHVFWLEDVFYKCVDIVLRLNNLHILTNL